MTASQDEPVAEAPDPSGTLARQALSSPSGRRLVLASLRRLARAHPSGPELIERTGARVFQLGGAVALRRMAESAEDENDGLAELTRHHLLSGFWRS